ncbi:MAG: cobyrinate a,c-diamide synthase [Victivallaceae bacterium]|nr:cobyrinate a,c-diamide synthase [Victivallaceae bacterium]
MANKLSAFSIAGTSSGDGKTTVTLALLRALHNRGLKVQPFKCGPDYIDPTFHHQACQCRSRNLDCWMMGKEAVKRSFINGSADMDCSVIEGVMGLYDASRPGTLSGSTAETALTLNTPVILTVNAKGMAGSIAALVKGYCDFCPELKIIGIIANRVGSAGHAALLREALELADLPPLLGYLLRDEIFTLPERHLGLVPFIEHEKSSEWFDLLAAEAEKCFAIDKMLELSQQPPVVAKLIHTKKPTVKLAIAYDQAFHFYYEDNLDILREAGFELVKFSPINDQQLPAGIAGIYLGGGFPEVFAKQLDQNSLMRQAIKDFAIAGGCIYAECGGFIYLTESLTNATGHAYQMCGVIPAQAAMNQRLRSLGYREVRSCHDSFLGSAGTALRGHEFHWSSIEFSSEPASAWKMRGTRKKSTWIPTGYSTENIIASYIHLHFASNPAAIKHWQQQLQLAL